MGISKSDALAKAMAKAREAGRVEGRAEMNRTRPVAAASSEFKSFSMVNVILSQIHRDKSIAKNEWEMSRDLCADWYRARSLTLANDASIGFLVPPDYQRENLIPLLRAPLVLDQLGVARMGGLTYAPVMMPRQSSASTGYWVGETANITESDQAVEMISLNPHKAGAATRISNTLIRKTPAAAEDFVRRDIAETFKRLIENAFFEGNGLAGKPVGLKNIPGINSISLAGGPGTIWGLLDDMIKEIEVDNADIGNLVWVMHPSNLHSLQQVQVLQTTGSAGYPVLSTGNVTQKIPRTLYGYPILTTTNIGAGTVYLINPAEVMFADWGPMEIRATSEGATLALSDMTLITCLQEVDVEVYHPVSICTGTGFAIS